MQHNYGEPPLEEYPELRIIFRPDSPMVTIGDLLGELPQDLYRPMEIDAENYLEQLPEHEEDQSELFPNKIY